jgi:DNA (cytosine-5)-methyltransferase 1
VPAKGGGVTLTFGSLFTGIGGMDLGLERAGMRCAWQVECDSYARTILRKHWPDVPKWGDVRTAGADRLARVDLICGGFPCQDISGAGTGAGLEGERSGLWFHFARIVRELRPRFVLVENVALLRRRGLDVVLGNLAESGFDAEWDCIPAAAVGAPHRRDRLFIVATRRADVANADRLSGLGAAHDDDREEPLGDNAHGRSADVANASGDGLEGVFVPWAAARAVLRSGGDRWTPEPDVGRVVDELPARVDRLRGLGNAAVPAVVEAIGRRIVAYAEAA